MEQNIPDKKSWVLEEYKLLSQHYFHEDKILMDALRSYTIINSALLAFFSSGYLQDNNSIGVLIPIVGIVLCFSSISTLIRLREWRECISARIREIEVDLHEIWDNNKSTPNLYVLDIKTMRNWNKKPAKKRWISFVWVYNFFRRIPSSFSILIVPIIFLSSWIVLLIQSF